MVFIIAKGEDPPSESNIDDFGLYTACQMTRGSFALYEPGKFAAKSRVGGTPLFWNPNTCKFSFSNDDDDESLVEFPSGYIYDFERDRLVCWDSMYYDKPIPGDFYKSVSTIRRLIEEAIEFRLPKCDAFLMSSGCGSRIVENYIDPEMWAYTIVYRHGSSMDGDMVYRDKRVIVYFDDDDQGEPMYILAKYLRANTRCKRFMTGICCTELFADSLDFRPCMKQVTDQFAKFNLEISSPFFDVHVVDYVLEYTVPEQRPRILKELLGNDDDSIVHGLSICDTVGDYQKKK